MLLNDSIILISVLIFAAVFLYILTLKKLTPKSIPADNTPEQHSKKNNLKSIKKSENSSKELSEAMQSKQTISDCSHHFGYLGTLPKNTPLPDECLGCPKIIKCLTRASTKKSLVKQK